MVRYTIRRPCEEFECPACGTPRLIGDRACDTGAAVYCSERCATGKAAPAPVCRRSQRRQTRTRSQ